MARPLKRKWEVGNDRCLIKVGAIDAAALGPLQETGARPRTRKKEKSSLYLCSDFSGWYNFGKIIKTVTTRCHILKLKCTKFDFGAGGAYSAPPDPLTGFKGPISKEKEGRGR